MLSKANPNRNTITVAECFGPTSNGEGDAVGEITVFIRTGGCDFRCVWCDSLHAVLPEHASEWTKYTPDQLESEVEKLTGGHPMNITLSGGNPALQPFNIFIPRMKAKDYTFTMETQGSIAADWFNQLDRLVLSPKPPSSGMENDWMAFDDCLEAAWKFGGHSRIYGSTRVSIKVVVMDEGDYQFAKSVYQRYPKLPFFMSVGNDNPPHQSADDQYNYGTGSFKGENIVNRTEWLIQKVAADTWPNNLPPRVIPQVHTLLWANTPKK